MEKSKVLMKFQKSKDTNEPHNELGHPSEEITEGTENAMGLKVTSTCKICEGHALGKAIKVVVKKLAIEQVKIKGIRIFLKLV